MADSPWRTPGFPEAVFSKTVFLKTMGRRSAA
jgi:hypothetical protein